MLLVRRFYPNRFTYSILWTIPTGAMWGEVSSGTQRHADCSGVWTCAPLIPTPTHQSTAPQPPRSFQTLSKINQLVVSRKESRRLKYIGYKSMHWNQGNQNLILEPDQVIQIWIWIFLRHKQTVPLFLARLRRRLHEEKTACICIVSRAYSPIIYMRPIEMDPTNDNGSQGG